MRGFNIMETTYDISEDIEFIVKNTFLEFLEVIQTKKQSKYAQTIDLIIKGIINENFNHYPPQASGELYSYVCGLKQFFMPTDKFVPKVQYQQFQRILINSKPRANNSIAIILNSENKIYAVSFMCAINYINFSEQKKLNIDSISKLLLEESDNDPEKIGGIFVVDPIRNKLDLINTKNIVLKKPKTRVKPTKELPGLIFVDKEDQFYDKLVTLQKDILKVNPSHYKLNIRRFIIGKDSSFSTKDLRFDNDLLLLLPGLAEKSHEVFFTAIRNISEYKEINLKTLREDVDSELRKTPTLNKQVVASITNSLYTFEPIHKRLFNHPEKTLVTKETLQNGANVIDFSDLSDDERLVALLAIQCICYNSLKPNGEGRMHIINDEASAFFPSNPPKAKKEYYARITERVNRITHDGRKRHLGNTLCTQNPKDIPKSLSEACQTLISFNHEDQNWLKKTLPNSDIPINQGEIALKYENHTNFSSLIETINISDNEGQAKKILRIIKPENKQIGYISSIEGQSASHTTKILYPAYASTDDNIRYVNKHDLLKTVEPEPEGDEIITFWKVDSIPKMQDSFSSSRIFGAKKHEIRQYQQYQEIFNLTPIKQIRKFTNGSTMEQSFQNRNYNNCQLITPTQQDYCDALDLPDKGIFIGVFKNTDIPIYLPFTKDYTQNPNKDWTLDKSMFIAGAQGKGKTNLLVYLFYQYAHPNPSDTAKYLLSKLKGEIS